jgi:cytochrome c-type biogenesis protein CcmH/NrfF
MRFLPIVVLAGCSFVSAAADDAPPLSAAQYTRAESLYWKVMARCCIRKPGALKIHQQIERAVAEGKTDEKILGDFTRRFGGGPVQLDDSSTADSEGSVSQVVEWSALPAVGIALCCGVILRRRLSGRRLPG